MELALPADDIEVLKATVMQQAERIESLRFEAAQRKQRIFGNLFERLPTLRDPNQPPRPVQ